MAPEVGVLDVVDAAIAAVDAAETVEIEMAQYPVTIASTKRPAAVILPADATEDEILELASWLVMGLRLITRSKARDAMSRLVLPR